MLERERTRRGVPFAEHRERPLSEQVDAFEDSLAAKDNAADYVKTTVSRVRVVAEGLVSRVSTKFAVTGRRHA